MRTASSSSTFSLTGIPSVVGRRMQPNPSTERSQASLPNLRYSINASPLLYPRSSKRPSTTRPMRRLRVSSRFALVTQSI